MNNPEWESLSRKVLACVLIDNGAIFPVLEALGDDINVYSPNERIIAGAVFQCVNDGQPPFIDLVVQKLNDPAKQGYARVIASQFNPIDNSNLVNIAKELYKIYRLEKTKSLGGVLSGASLSTLDETIKSAEVALSSLSSSATRRQADAETLDSAAWGMVVDTRYMPIPSGLDWFDAENGGFWPGENYWFVAPYKSRKTTIARNAVIASARAGFPVAFFAAEGQREIFTLDCQCAMATEYLIRQRKEKDPQWAGFNTINISHKRLMKSFRYDSMKLTPEESEAIGEARTEWRKLPIRVYDGLDQIRSLPSLRYILKRDKLEYGLKSFWIDYSQLFGDPGSTLFERQSATSLFVQSAAADEKLAACAISQQNEEAVKYGNRNSHSPGVKGGGDAPAASDVTFESWIDPDADYILHIKIKLGRAIGNFSHQHIINVPSGLFVDKWFKRR